MNSAWELDFEEQMKLVMDGQTTPPNLNRLDALLAENPEAMDAYIALLKVDAMLRWRAKQAQGEESRPEIESAESVASHGVSKASSSDTASRGPSRTTPGTPIRPVLQIPPIIAGSAAETPHGLTGFFASDWPMAYLASAVICTIGILILASIPVHHYIQVARQPDQTSSASASLPSPLAPRPSKFPPMIGQITGMVDCKWSDPQTEASNGASVPLGRKYALSSGLMQITYDTGAKVILQGPCTYEVESKAGGFLSLGRLTAKLEKKNTNSPLPSDGRGAGGEGVANANSPLSTLHSPLFTITTPTATVTDLGTEFGVEVRESGATSANVFQGEVEVRPVARDDMDRKQFGRAVRLTENESAHIENSEVIVQRGKLHAAKFVRIEQLPKFVEELRLKPFRRWQSYRDELRLDPSLVAYYDFQQIDGRPTVLPNVAANGDHALDGVVENATWTNGRTTGKQALLFQNLSDHVAIDLPGTLDVLTVAAWVSIDALDKPFQSLLASEGWGETGRFHWHLLPDGCAQAGVHGDTLAYTSDPVPRDFGLSRKWMHLALIVDHPHQCVKFFLDGRPIGSHLTTQHTPISIGPAWIGAWKPEGKPVDGDMRRDFRGRIDELVVFGRALSDQEMVAMYESGKP